MFKWKVSSLGRSSKKLDKLNNAKDSTATETRTSEVFGKDPDTLTDAKQDQESYENSDLPRNGAHHQLFQAPFSPILPNRRPFHEFHSLAVEQQTKSLPYMHHRTSAYKEASHTEEIQSKMDDDSHSWNEWNQQLQAYTAWVNSQLRKRPDLPLVTDLGGDFQDGVLLARLIEILSNKEIYGIVEYPLSAQTKRDNLERILTFLATQRVRTSTVTSRDLAAGNLKATLRLILALASHYKPHSVKQGRDAVNGSQTTPNLNIPANRKFTVGIDSNNEEDEFQSKGLAINAFATLRRPTGNLSRRPTIGAMANLGSSTPGPQHKTYQGQEPAPQETQRSISFRAISSSRSLANLASLEAQPSLNPSTSSGDLLSASGTSKPILKKESKFGSKRELPALGVSAVVSKGRPTAMEFWESIQQTPDANAAFCTDGDGLRSSMRRVLPQPPAAGLTVYTGGPGDAAPPALKSDPLGSRGEVEGSSNQPSPTCNAKEGDLWNDERNEDKNDGFTTEQQDSLLSEINRTRKQFTELRNWLLANPVPEAKVNSVMTESKGTSVSPDDGDAISWLRTKLQDVEQRCNTVQVDLKKAQNECVTLDGNRRGLAVCLANQEDALNSLRQDLLRVTLANQSLSNEKIDLQRKLEERDRQITDLRRQLAAKDRLVETQRSVLEEASKSFTPALRAKLDKNIGSIDARRSQYREELQVAREALSSLRGNFRSNDPNHHILDTLEQCMAFLMERVVGTDLGGFTSAHSNLETQAAASKRSISSNNYNGMQSDPFTKVVYFTDRTVTPYLSVIPRRLGDVTLRDFKMLFDRPGVYRFHFKAPDAEYGFVKEEIADDDTILPGFEGKVIAWVEEASI